MSWKLFLPLVPGTAKAKVREYSERVGNAVYASRVGMVVVGLDYVC